ncbi:MAG: hypothetical protein L6R41_005668 [Letrouitia leprolyta]|nr:MAG: hypothetical protein L6R41_005668 [Letrouitia leprolyta]
MGFRVVAPDMIGYGQSEAPRVPQESIAYYSFKRVANDMKELARQLGISRIIAGGHDCGRLEKVIKSKEQIKQLLNSLYGGRTSKGEPGFDVKHGIHLDRLSQLNLNWYKSRKQNFEDELALENPTIDVPILFIAATKDEALPPSMSKAMDRYIPKLTRKTVDAYHWALWEKPEETLGLRQVRPGDGRWAIRNPVSDLILILSGGHFFTTSKETEALLANSEKTSVVVDIALC